MSQGPADLCFTSLPPSLRYAAAALGDLVGGLSRHLRAAAPGSALPGAAAPACEWQGGGQLELD